MPKETKKQKLNPTTGGTLVSSSSSDDVKDLKEYLQQCDTPFFIKSLCKSLDDFPPETIQMLAQVLDPILEVAITLQHCVRCHKLFSEADNTT
ncbi:hypothetical protein FRC10_005877 [Ceratobasidium sp. 414]|nr:hypothetical protein FRC10_005877 [Ceratobasidium sp. 414]